MSTESEKAKKLIQLLLEAPGSTLVIIGAGASKSSGVKLASELRDDLLSRWGPELTGILKNHNFEVDGKESSTWGKAPLEVVLSAYAEWAHDDMAPYLFLSGARRMPDRYAGRLAPPNRTYEILAHLMSHRIVNHVISLNWDELLERSLDEEIGPGGYERIESISGFQKLVFLPSRLTDRMLLKPHGTIGRPITMRLSWEAVRKLDPPKSEALELVLRNIMEHGSRPATLLFVGTSYSEPDIQRFFRLMAARGLVGEAFFVNPQTDLIEGNGEARTIVERQWVGGSKAELDDWVENHHIVMGSDEFFDVVAREMKGTSSESAPTDGKENPASLYPGAQRHLIRLAFFENGLEPTVENRLLLELIIFAVKVKGLFTARALLECNRLSAYATELADGNPKLGPFGILTRLTDNRYRLFTSPKELGRPVDRFYFFQGKEEWFCDKAIQTICDWTGVNLDPQSTGQLSTLFKALLDDFDVDIVSSVTQALFAFRSPQKVRDRGDFRKRTREVIKSTEDKELMVVSETGEWLVSQPGVDPKLAFQNRRVKLLVSDPNSYPEGSSHRERAVSNLQKLLSYPSDRLEIRGLPWQENHDHMTIGSDKALFFQREGKCPTLSPVYLDVKDDVEMLTRYFKDLLWKAGKMVEVRPSERSGVKLI